MDVLVRVDVGRVPADELPEGGKLTSQLVRHRRDIVRRNYFVHRHPGSAAVGPLSEIEVQTEAEITVLSAVGGSLARGRPAYHEAGARNDAVFVGFDDALVHAETPAEVVGVDDQAPLGSPV
jgi:hypothetical protein